jgi:hypothetical protein
MVIPKPSETVGTSLAARGFHSARCVKKYTMPLGHISIVCSITPRLAFQSGQRCNVGSNDVDAYLERVEICGRADGF